MIVVGVVRNMFVSRLPVAKVALYRQAAFNKQFHRAVNGGITDARLNLPDLLIKFVQVEMTFGSKENLNNEVPLGCHSHAQLSQKLAKSLH